MEKIGKTLMQTFVRANFYLWRDVATWCSGSPVRNSPYMAYSHSCFGFLAYMQRNLKYFEKMLDK